MDTRTRSTTRYRKLLVKPRNRHEFLMRSAPCLLDYALLPFIRQFSRVNKPVFAHERYTNLRRWLRYHLQSRLFSRAMFKYPLWLDNHEECLLGE